jgi:branched-chain amino acid transport system substrate-binding protein
MKGKRSLTWAFLTFVLLFVAACGDDGEGLRAVRIGAVYPLTGSLAAEGNDVRRGIELAVRIVDDETDLSLPLARSAGLPALGGVPLEVVFADHAGDSERAADEAARLVQNEKVVAVLGAYNSDATAAASARAEQIGVPFLSALSTSPILTERGLRWFFRTTPDDAIFVQGFFDFLADVRGRLGIVVDSVAIVYEDSLFGSGVAELERQGAAAAGLEVVADVPYSAASTDLEAEALRVAEANAPLLMQASYENDAILLMQAYRRLGYRPDALLAMDAGFTTPSFVQTLGDDANGVLSREVWAPDLATTNPLVAEVNALYRERFGTDLTGNGARALTGVLVLADAIDRGGSTDPERIRAALRATDLSAEELIVPWDGVRFDPETGQNTLARGIMVQIQEQAYHTVWPANLAARDLIWPMPDWSSPAPTSR